MGNKLHYFIRSGLYLIQFALSDLCMYRFVYNFS